MPSTDKHPGKTHGKLYLSELEVKVGNPTGGTEATSTVQSLWDSHSVGPTGELHEDVQMQEVYGDASKVQIHGDGIERWGNITQLVQEVRWGAGGGSCKL